MRTVTISALSDEPGLLETVKAQAAALGCRHDVVPVEAAQQGLAAAMAGLAPQGGTERFLEAARGSILVALADGLEAMIVVTANRSNIAVGAFGLQTGACGSFHPIRGLFHGRVRDLLRWRTRHRTPEALGPAGAFVSEDILNRIPPGEADLDGILECLLDRNLGAADIAARGFAAADVARIAGLVYRAEGRRRRVLPGVGLMRNDGRDERRYPLNSRFETGE